MPWRDVIGRAAQTARLMVGVPDYGAYVAHRERDHPGEPIMTRTAFYRERTERRFGGGADRVSRCC
jgi:uncharacterized short protein YbdD (DUF466 family)